MSFNFDEQIERKNTDSIKFDNVKSRGKSEDLLPLWVADMDFSAPDEVINALVERAQHGIFGYSEPNDAYYDALGKWFLTRLGWEIKRSWVVMAPGVVYAINTAIRAFTSKGDAVLIQQPVYYPFASSIEKNERRLVSNDLVYENGRYTIDFEDFKRKIIDNEVKLFILCSPHNPVGRVWTENELVKMGEICLKYGVIVLSDEIHGDFIYKGNKHSVFANLRPEFAEVCITCTAPTKTFNLAGLHISNIIISNKTLRKSFKDEINRTGMSQLGIMGIVACRTAYEHGGEWLDALLEYLNGNLNFVRDFIAQKLQKLKLVEPEGTYLVWIDFRGLELNDKELERLIEDRAKLWLDGGIMFGKAGSGFERINIACPRKTLEQAFFQLEQAIDELS